jgi:hypothetical protein
LALLTLAAGTAHSTTLTFDDITGSTGGLPMPQGYAGFDWGDAWHAMVPANAPSETFLAHTLLRH